MRNVVLCFLLAVWLPGSSTGTSGGPANVVARSLSEEHVARPQADLELRCNSADFLGPNLLVAARHDEDVSWLATHLDGIPFMVYQDGDETAAHHHVSVGREAMAYLTFISEYYSCLPEVTAFVHGHRWSWHSPDMVHDVARLNWDAIPGYATLSRRGTLAWHAPHCHSHESPRLYPGDPERHLETPLAGAADALNGTYKPEQIVYGTAYPEHEVFSMRFAHSFARTWPFFEAIGLGPLPAEIHYYCCAQFAVSQERIRLRPRKFYLQVAHWLQFKAAESLTYSYHAGLMLEMIWHVIFGEPAVLPGPIMPECELYRCDPGTTMLSWHTAPGIDYR